MNSWYLGTKGNREDNSWLFVGLKADGTSLIQTGGLNTNFAVRNLEGFIDNCEEKNIIPLRLYSGFGLSSAIAISEHYLSSGSITHKLHNLDKITSDYYGNL